eukprot:SAG11_NODE_175_length_13457_cov_42.095673_5_plen_52_part_00
MRQFEACGYAGDVKEPGILAGRAAYSNTIQTARLRETLRKELKVKPKDDCP